MADVLVGTSGWSYNDKADKGGWVGPFYPNKSTKKLPFYSQYFDTAEFDSIYYAKFYEKMGRATFDGMVKNTPADFQFSVKVPETVTREKKLSISKGAFTAFEEYLERLSPLKKANKLGAILFQMSSNFTVDDFKQAESFLDKLPRDYHYALEFRHASWQTEGALELLKHYNIASVMTDSPDPQLQYLARSIVTADHAFIRFHGRNKGFWYNYLYTKQELQPWVEKVNEIAKNVKVLHVYFNNHYGAKAIINSLEFKEMLGEITELENNVLQKARAYVRGEGGLESWLS